MKTICLPTYQLISDMQGVWIFLVFIGIIAASSRACEKILNRPTVDQKNFDRDIDDVIAELFYSDVTDIREVFVSKDGHKVGYEELAENWLFQKYRKDSGMLMQMHPEKLEENARKAFFINVYNFFTIHAILDYTEQVNGGQLPNSTRSIPNFWTDYCYNIGGFDYSLDDIEHGVLRANKGTANHPPLEDSDPRINVTLTNLDQRVHFALNCGGIASYYCDHSSHSICRPFLSWNRNLRRRQFS